MGDSHHRHPLETYPSNTHWTSGTRARAHACGPAAKLNATPGSGRQPAAVAPSRWANQQGPPGDTISAEIGCDWLFVQIRPLSVRCWVACCVLLPDHICVCDDVRFWKKVVCLGDETQRMLLNRMNSVGLILEMRFPATQRAHSGAQHVFAGVHPFLLPPSHTTCWFRPPDDN